MNICFISPGQFNATQGGIDRVCSQLVECFRKKGHVVLCCYLWQSCVPDHDKEMQFQFPDTEDVASERNVLYLHDLLIRHKVDIICNHSFLIAQHDVCAAAKKGTSAKLIYTLHTDPDAFLKDILDKREKYVVMGNSIASLWNFTRSLLLSPVSHYLRKSHNRKRFRKLHNESDHCVLLSRTAAESFARHADVSDLHKISIIHNPLPQPVQQNEYSARKKQILFVGRLTWQKRVDRLLKVWKRLQSDFPEWSLLIVGDGPDRKFYEKITQSLQLKNVSFTGTKPSEPFYRESIACCVTSTHEGFSMVLIEAQQYGCIPVVYDSFGSVHDIITNGITGYAVTPFKEKEFVDRLRTLMLDDKLRKEMSIQSIAASNRYSKEIIIGKWEKLFLQLMKECARSSK